MAIREIDRAELLKAAVRKRLKQVVAERMALRLYRPNPGPQEQFHKSKKRIRFLFGGNRSGKTTAGAVEALWFAMGMHPYRRMKPLDGWIVSPTFDVQREAAQEKILKYLPTTTHKYVKIVYRDKARGYIDRIVIPVCPANSPGVSRTTITFKSAEQGREVFQGASVPWIWMDEEVPIEIYQECLMRVMDCQGDIWGTMTPLIGDLYQLIVEELADKDPELAFWHMTWDDNPILLPDEKTRLLATMPEEEQEARIYGRWVPRTGRVFKKFREEVHVVEPFEIPATWRKVAGFDHGLRAPTAAVWLALSNDGDAYVYDEHYEAEKPPEHHAPFILKRGVRRIKADPSIWNRQATGQSVAAMYRKCRVFMLKAAKGEGTWEARMELIRQCLDYERRPDGAFSKRPRLYVFSKCTNLIRELRSLAWKPSRVGILHEDVKGDDHAIDALGYALEDVASAISKNQEARLKRGTSAYRPRSRVTGY